MIHNCFNSKDFDRTSMLSLQNNLNELRDVVREVHKSWWFDIETGEPIERNVGELLMLMVSELAEGLEGHRRDLMDDKLPHRKMLEVEMADCIIRILDFCGGFNLDVGGAFVAKLAYNATRADHKVEQRRKPGGKKY